MSDFTYYSEGRPVMGEKMELIQQLRGRAAFLRDKGRIKSPQIMEQAADALAHLTQPAQAVDVGAIPANCRQRLAHEGKPYPRSGCAVCGRWAPNLERCNDKLTAALPNANGKEG